MRRMARNDLLPAHVVASFCKRLLRNCLIAPPQGCLYCLGLVSNLLQQHPEINTLVHRSSGTVIQDPFDSATDDPTETCALQSSVWELDALRHHSYAAVATLAQAVGCEHGFPKITRRTCKFRIRRSLIKNEDIGSDGKPRLSLLNPEA